MRILLVLAALSLAACGGSSDDSKTSKAVDDVKQAAESVGEAVEEVVEDTSESISDTYKETMDKAEDVGEVIKESAEDVEEAIKEAHELGHDHIPVWKAVGLPQGFAPCVGYWAQVT